jgi:hypothetical protein
MSSARVAVAVTALVLLVVAALAWKGPLTRDRTPVAATGAPAPVNEIQEITVRPGQLLCASDILLGPRTQEAELVVQQEKRRTPPLVVSVQAGGYRSPPVRVPPSDAGLHPINVPIDPPERTTIGRLCVRNAGDEAATFVGTTELRTYTRLRTSIDGEDVAPDLALTFYERRQVSALGELGGIVDRITINRGFLGGGWFVWPLLLLVAIGVPLLVLGVLYRALRDAP